MKGLGCTYDPPAHRVTSARRMLGYDPPPASAMGMASANPPAWEQLSTSACVGFATARALTILSDGDPTFSPQGIYTLARCVDRAGMSVALQDEGSMPNEAMRALEEWGGAPLSDWEFNPYRINAEPTIEELKACKRFDRFTYRKIYSTGTERFDDIKRALASYTPVIFAIEVDSGFENYEGGVLGGAGNDSLGGHMLCAWGFEGDVGHGTNSWGSNWGESGHFRFGPAFVDRMRDIYVVRLA